MFVYYSYNPIWLRSKGVAMAVQKPGIYRSSLRANCIYGGEEKVDSLHTRAREQATVW